MKKTLLFAFIGIVFYTACTRISTTEIGTGLIPAVDGINTVDTTFDVITDNISVDSIRTSKYQEQALGYMNDPIFGLTTATLNLELKPIYFPQGFEVREDSVMLDSAVLVLKYVDVWGDSSQPISFSVYELADKMKADSVYSNRTHFQTSTKLSVDKNFDIRTFNDIDTSRAGLFKEASTNQIRIPLTNAFGNKLIHTFDTTTNGANNAYYSDSVFSERFHGFSIVPNTSSNALLRISLQDTNTKVVLYYRYWNRTVANRIDTAVRYFRPGFTSGSSNEITRNRAGFESSTTSAVNSTLVNGVPSDSLLYLQSGPGHRISIKIPNLNSTYYSNRVIHRAELYMEQVADANTNTPLDYFTQPNLFLSAYSSDSSRRFHIPNDIALGTDGSVSNLTTFGGYIIYKNDPVSGKRIATYAFNISRYVQGIVTRKEKAYDLNLFAPVYDYISPTESSSALLPIYSDQLNPPGIGRVRLGGGSSKLHKMKLRIIYSKI